MMNKRLIAVTATMIPILSILWAIQAPLILGLEIARIQYLAVSLGVGCSLVYLSQKSELISQRILTYTLALISFLTFIWISINYQRFQMDFPYLTTEMQILGGLVVLLVLDAIRRTTGWILLAVIGVFLLYALVGEHIPAPLTGTNSMLDEIVVYMAFDPNAILGTPLGVIASIVIVFIFFGKLLVRTGCGEFFIDLAMASMGKRRGSRCENINRRFGSFWFDFWRRSIKCCDYWRNDNSFNEAFGLQQCTSRRH
ncbi:TRAP transporter large permease subunit [Psychromonas sp. KJ10-10]|uniref:TRAP transporter large permease subunit n=1 Tax=Psychromonas sp. KJ10-10 TaxID=3391823 RepID=UPI0039B4D9C9